MALTLISVEEAGMLEVRGGRQVGFRTKLRLGIRSRNSRLNLLSIRIKSLRFLVINKKLKVDFSLLHTALSIIILLFHLLLLEEALRLIKISKL